MIVAAIVFCLILALIEYSRWREREDFNQERKNWSYERKDLYDRIQSGSLTEYKEATQEVKTFEPVVKSEEDEFWQEIEENKR